jgi:tetratricopeptide (TPR) repeat protein
MGWVYSYERDWMNAENEFRRAIELNPSLTQIYTSFSISTLRPLGTQGEALRLLRTALKYDPLSLDVLREIGSVQIEAGLYDEAIVSLQRVQAVDPGFPFAESFLAEAMMYAGALEDAITIMERLDGRFLGQFRPSPSRPRRSPSLALAYQMAGQHAEAAAVAAEHADTPAYTASFYAAAGDTDRALDALERLAVTSPHHLGRRLVRPEMAALRNEPRLVSLRQRFGLPINR